MSSEDVAMYHAKEARSVYAFYAPERDAHTRKPDFIARLA
jgi:hypothetical protein